MKTRALSLIEVVVALGLLALILPLALNLVPSALFAQRRAQQTEAALALAQGWLEVARVSNPLPLGLYGPDSTAAGTVVREVYAVDTYQLDVVVVVQPVRGEPISLATRILKK